MSGAASRPTTMVEAEAFEGVSSMGTFREDAPVWIAEAWDARNCTPARPPPRRSNLRKGTWGGDVTGGSIGEVEWRRAASEGTSPHKSAVDVRVVVGFGPWPATPS